MILLFKNNLLLYIQAMRKGYSMYKVKDWFAVPNNIMVHSITGGYCWTVKSAVRLLKGIMKTPIFLSNVYCIENPFDTLIIIDGHQRLLTVFLLAKLYGIYEDVLKEYGCGNISITCGNSQDTQALLDILNDNVYHKDCCLGRAYEALKHIVERDPNKSTTIKNLQESFLHYLILPQEYYDDLTLFFKRMDTVDII